MIDPFKNEDVSVFITITVGDMRKNRLSLVLTVILIWCGGEALAQKRITDLQTTVILISIDGFRYDYVEKFQPPEMMRLARQGTQAKWLVPSYPTKTFPNHYTIVTGLYPGNHGIIENNMFDAEIGSVFGINKPEQVSDPRWWGGEPIWNTVQRQGQIAASFFWPGSEAPIQGMVPLYWKKYVHETPHEVRVDTVLKWLDLPKSKRPTMVTMYFSDVDDAGHFYGPDSPENKAAVLKVDRSVENLMKGLNARGIDKEVHVILVSDHGMSRYTNRNSIVLDELFDPADAERIFWVSEITQIFPKPGKEDVIYNALKAKLPPTATVYRKSELPSRWHIGHSARIAPIIVVPTEGTAITTRQRFTRMEKDGTLDRVRGAHGSDNQSDQMRTLFIGHGGRFRRGVMAEPFPNVDIYEVMCRILKIKPAKNDGDPGRYKALLR